MTLSDMTDDDVNTMFRPKLDALGVLHALSLRTCSSVRIVLVDIRTAGFAVAGPLRGDQTFLDTFAYARAQPGLPAIDRELGIVEIVGRQCSPKRTGR